ncbi:hypothetical protein LL969_20850 [Xanthomonas campestris pv. phormiicola]|nr:hypothetical protein [Xanthomonas campestris pv. phormiicola]
MPIQRLAFVTTTQNRDKYHDPASRRARSSVRSPHPVSGACAAARGRQRWRVEFQILPGDLLWRRFHLGEAFRHGGARRGKRGHAERGQAWSSQSSGTAVCCRHSQHLVFN